MTELRRAWGAFRTSLVARDWEDTGLWLVDICAYTALAIIVVTSFPW